MDGTELSLNMPPELPGNMNECKIKKCKEDVKCLRGKQDKCNEHKLKVFVIMRGQCSLSVKNRLESNEDYKG